MRVTRGSGPPPSTRADPERTEESFRLTQVVDVTAGDVAKPVEEGPAKIAPERSLAEVQLHGE